MTEKEFILSFAEFYDLLIAQSLGADRELDLIIEFCSRYECRSSVFIQYLAQDKSVGYIDYLVHVINEVAE